MHLFKNEDYTGKFIILAHARSGSTNLSQILASHPDIWIAGEPFHVDYLKWHPEEVDYGVGSEISNRNQLRTTLNAIFSHYSGIKTLMRQLTPELNKFILQLPGLKVIYLYRSNLLQSAISIFISGQANIWYKRVDEDKNPLLEMQFEPISIDMLSKEMEKLKSRKTFYSGVLAGKPAGDVMNITYEEIYFSDPQTKRSKIELLFDFLGYEFPMNTEIDRFLDPSLAKMNSSETYKKIPNAMEIESALGSDETGWLFK